MPISAAELLVKVGYDDSELERGTQRSHNIIGGLSTGLLAVGGAAAVGLGAVGVMGLKAAGDFQQTRIAFEGLLGSAEGADAFLGQMRDFAARTPFEMPGLLNASKMLLATGTAAGDIIPTMTTLGNVTSTLGGGPEQIESVVRALGQMKGKGKVSAEEINQIGEALPGFSAWGAIANGAGITIAEAMDRAQKGTLDAATAIPMLLQGMQDFPGAAGAMDRQSKTLNGVISTLKDTFMNALIDGIEPFLPALADFGNKMAPVIGIVMDFAMNALRNLITQLGKLGPIFTLVKDNFMLFFNALRTGMTKDEGSTIETVALKIRGAIETVIPVIKTFANGIKEVWNFIASDSDKVIAVAAGIGVVLVAMFLAWAVSAASAAVATIAAAAPLILLGAAIGLLVAAIIYLWNTNETFRSVITDIWEGISGVITGVIAVVRVVIETFIKVVSALWEDWGGVIMGVVQIYWTLMREYIQTVFGVIMGIWNIFAGIFTGDWDRVWKGIQGIVSSIFNGIRDTISGIFGGTRDIIAGIINNIVDFFWGIPGRIAGAFIGMFDGLWNAFSAVVNRVVGAWNNLSLTLGGGSYDPLGKFGPTVQVPSFTIGTPNLPYLQAGGRVLETGLAIVHKGETVVPANVVTPLNRSMVGGTTNVITVNMPPGSNGEDVVDALRKYMKVNGAIPVSVTGATF